MKKSCLFLIIICSLFTHKISYSQFSTISFPNEFSIKDINNYKLNGISLQIIKRKDCPEKYYKSTSFFISKNYLLTSAHNLYDIKSHSPEKIKLYPSCKGNGNPYGVIKFNINSNHYKKITRNFFKLKWRKRTLDMALIYIPDSILKKNNTLTSINYLPILNDSIDIYKDDTIYCVGYPATGVYAKQNVMTLVKSTIKNMHKYHFSHNLETYRGNSGSPIMVKRNGQFYVIGINSIFGHGTLIYKERENLINKWMKELEELNK
ncbi:MAG: trypsin-like peptidase domain-containing protein [Flavobacteriales bacterium]|nr:trypsin-like peptidase domain-containing protein [Flavobacteriales bacterium]